MPRFSLKVVGSSGQGINSIGEILGKGLKRSGYCIFGYREYPSLIKGGHSSYQVDIDQAEIRSTETMVNVLVALNHHGLEFNLHEVKEGGVIVHQTPDWQFSKDDQAMLTAKNITVIQLSVDEILVKLKAKPILGNVLLTSFLWSLLKQDVATLKALVTEQFGHKQDLLALNMQCIEEGIAVAQEYLDALGIKLPRGVKRWKDHLLVTGSQAMGLGAVHAGVRLYAGYPMTPSSPLLSYISDIQNVTGMVVKQAEDEITAAQMVSGAMFAGTRALTATSGGGFDLMSETISLNAIIENPTVFVLAQRPGPATGLPTWTAQGDLLLAVHSAHGEFARLVMSVSDSEDSFSLMNEAFNLAEEYQLSVIILTDKQIAEALYTQKPFDQKKTKIKRGLLITDPKKLAKLRPSDRYKPDVATGISPRWLPGVQAAVYCAQGDEHSSDGTVDETATNAREQLEKRRRKMDALKKALPEPELFGAKDPEVLLIGWGSTKGPVLDAIEAESLKRKKIGYLHFTHLWPLKTEKVKQLTTSAKRVILIEGNSQGQLGMLIRQECSIEIPEKILKYDGRPFFIDELLQELEKRLLSEPPLVPSEPVERNDISQPELHPELASDSQSQPQP